jgi:hypothetical protein
LNTIAWEHLGTTLVEHFLKQWDDKIGGGELAVLLRSSLAHEDARNKMRQIFETQLVSALVPICGPSRARYCAALVSSQMLGLALTRYLLEFSATKAMPVEMLQETIGQTIQNYLDFPVSPK